VNEEIVVVESAVVEQSQSVSTDEKIDAIAKPSQLDTAGFTVKAFSSMRKGFLQMTGNELENSERHCREYITANNIPDEELKSPEKSWDIMTKAIPDFLFHLTALAYVSVTPTAELVKFIGKNRELFNTKVSEFWDKLSDEQWQTLTIEAFKELIEANVGNDFKVKDEPGATKSPNS